jgi:glucosamine-6-phosphate deaminase
MIIVTNKKEQAYDKAAQMIVDLITSNPNAIIGCATGSTPLPLYDRIALAHSKGLDLSKVKTFNLDEYVGLAQSDSNSYHTYMFDNLFNRVNIPRENINLLNGGAVDIIKEFMNYERKIMANPIDLQILGIGENGHIGFNEPGTPFGSLTHIADLSESTIAANAQYFPKGIVPKQAITMGLLTIMQAKKIIILAFGAKKANAVKAMLEGPVDPACPASVLRNHPNVVYILDKEAANYLSKQ